MISSCNLPKSLFNLKTPSCIYQSKKGTVQHLTLDRLKNFNVQAVLLSMGDFWSLDKKLESSWPKDLTFKKYLGFSENVLLVLSPLDVTKNSVDGCNNTDVVKLITSEGYRNFDIEKVKSLVNIIKPDILIPLTEEPVADKAGVKSQKRCVKKSLDFLDKTLHSLSQSDPNQTMPLVFASIQGGLNEKLREESTAESLKRKINGVVIQGLCNGEDFQERQRIYDVINATIGKREAESETLIKVLHCLGEPLDIIHGLLNKIDIFESDFPFTLATDGIAAIYDFNQFNCSEPLPNQVVTPKEFNSKRLRRINLHDESYAKELIPLQKGCKCFSCTHHTRSYVNHLLKVKEMTANILLALHNIFVYEKFFEELGEAYKNSRSQEYASWFLESQTEPF